MNRRNFVKAAVLAGLGWSLPVELSATITIVDIKVTDDIKDIMKFGGTRMEDSQWVMDVELEVGKMWDYVMMIDDEDREWKTDDEGTTWRNGLMSFEVFEIEIVD